MFKLSTASQQPVKSARATRTTNTAYTVAPAQEVTHVDTVIALRDKANSYFDTYVVKGRKAMLQLLNSIYSAYCAAVEEGSAAALVAALKEKLKADEKAVPAKASDCSVLIRFVFSSFSPKQIYVYSRALEIANEKKIATGDFTAFVNDAHGLENLCAANLTSGAESTATNAIAIAIDLAKNAPATQTIQLTSWAATEKARIFIGISDGNGMVKLVDANMTEKSVEATLKRYRIDTEQAKKVKEAASKAVEADAAGKMVIELAIERRSKAHLRMLTAEQELMKANTANYKLSQDVAKALLQAAEDALEEADAELTKLKERFKQQAVA